MALQSLSLCTNSSLGGAVKPLWIDFHKTEYMESIVSKLPEVKRRILTQLCFLNKGTTII